MLEPPMALVDIGLPGLDGYQVLRHIRSQPECKEGALIAMNGYQDGVRALEAGFDAHLLKPFDSAALLALVEEFQSGPTQ
jgi:CheY-like chemotaxis protein